jgi:hypothetical protein
MAAAAAAVMNSRLLIILSKPSPFIRPEGLMRQNDHQAP